MDQIGVDLTAIQVELNKARVFASSTAVAPAVPGSPTDAEIAAFATTGNHRNVVLYFNGTTVAVTAATHIFHVDGAGAVSRLVAPAGTSSGLSMWGTGTVYAVNNMVVESNRIYRALTAHTAGVFATDLGAARWVEVSADLDSITSPDSNTFVTASNTSIAFTVEGNPVGGVVWDALSGMPKWTLGGALDPIAYAGTPRTIAQRNTLTPLAGWLVYVSDGAVNEYQMWDGAAWVTLGSDPAFPAWQPATAYVLGDRVTYDRRLWSADGPHTSAATFNVALWNEISAAPYVQIATRTAVAAAVPASPTLAEIEAYATVFNLAGDFVSYTGTDNIADPVTHVWYINEGGLATPLRSPAEASLYRGALAALTNLTALPTAGLIAGEAYRVGDTIWVWDPTAGGSSGGIQPADTPLPGVSPGYWVSTSGHYKGAYSTSVPYVANDIVFHGGSLWRSNAARPAGVWTATPTEGPSGANSWTRVTGPIIGPFAGVNAYTTGQLVYDASNALGAGPGVYRALAPHAAGNLADPDDWEPLAQRSTYRGDYGTGVYLIGDVVHYLGDLYRCVVAHGSNSFGGPFTPANWELIGDPQWEFTTNNIQTVAGHWYIIDGAHTVLMPVAPVNGASVQFSSPVEWSTRGATFSAAGATTIGAGQTGMFAGYDVIEMTYSSTGDNWVVHVGSGSAPPADTIENLNATGSISAWGSVIVIGATAPTANMVLTLPTAAGSVGQTIKLVRVDNTAFTVTLAAQAGEAVTLLSAGTELNTQHGSLTVEATTATAIRQVGQVAAGGTTAPLHYASFIAESGSGLGGNAGALTVVSTSSTTASVVPPTTARLPLATIGGLTVTASVSGPTVSGNQLIIGATGRYTINGYSQQRGNSGATANNNEVAQIIVNGAIVATFAARENQGAVGFSLPIGWAGNLTAGDAVDIRVRRGGATDVDINRYTIIVQQEPTATTVNPGSITPTTLTGMSLRRLSTTASTALNTITVVASNATNVVYPVGQRVPFTAPDVTLNTGSPFTVGTNTLTCAKAGTYRVRAQTLLTSGSGSFKFTQLTVNGAIVDQAIQGVASAFHGDNDILYTRVFAIGDVIDLRVADGTATSVALHRLAIDIQEIPASTVPYIVPADLQATNLAFATLSGVGSVAAGVGGLGSSAGGLTVTSTSSTDPSVAPPTTARIPWSSVAGWSVGLQSVGVTVGVDTVTAVSAGRFTVTGVVQIRGVAGATTNNSEAVQLLLNGVVVATFAARDLDTSTVGRTLPVSWEGDLGAGDVLDLRVRRGGATTVDVYRANINIRQVPTTTVVQENLIPAYTVTTKTVGYTTNSGDFGGYIRFTAGVPTFHAPLAADVGKQIVIRNATGAQITCVAGAGATISGSLVVANAENLAVVCTAAGTYDAVGGI
jgi:hypothetical protein